jgi:DNA polymerase III subunit beta
MATTTTTRNTAKNTATAATAAKATAKVTAKPAAKPTPAAKVQKPEPVHTGTKAAPTAKAEPAGKAAAKPAPKPEAKAKPAAKAPAQPPPQAKVNEPEPAKEPVKEKAKAKAAAVELPPMPAGVTMRVGRKEMSTKLEEVLNVAQKKASTIPILAFVLFRPSPTTSRVSVLGTDLDVYLQSSMAAQVADGAKPFALPAKRLADVIKQSPGEFVDFICKDDHVLITSERYKVKLSTAAVESFPGLPEIPAKDRTRPALIIDAETFLEGINQTSYAITQEESRYALAGVKVELDGQQIRQIATDGHRLAFWQAEHGGLAAEKDEFMIPSQAVKSLWAAFAGADKLRFKCIENYLWFSHGDTLLVSRMLTGNFPDYRLVLPKAHPHKVTFESAPLLRAIKRVALMSDEKSHSLKMVLREGAMHLSAETAEMGSSEDVISTDYSGPEITIGVNSLYVIGGLERMTERVQLSFKDGNSVLMFNPSDNADCRYVVMPMRL